LGEGGRSRQLKATKLIDKKPDAVGRGTGEEKGKIVTHEDQERIDGKQEKPLEGHDPEAELKPEEGTETNRNGRKTGRIWGEIVAGRAKPAKSRR